MKFTANQIAGLSLLGGFGLGLMAASQGKSSILILGLVLVVIGIGGVVAGTRK